VNFLNGDQLLATLGTPNATLSVWDFEPSVGKLTRRWTAENQYIEAMTSHRESDLLITADSNGRICGRDAANGMVRWSCDTNSEISALAFTPTANRLLTVEAEGHVQIIDLNTLKPIASTIAVGATGACAISKNGRRIWIGCGNELDVFDLIDDLQLGPLQS
jgi:WD40 repeat protein